MISGAGSLGPRRGRIGAVSALAIALTACGGPPATADPSRSHVDSGIRGRVLLGPTCPVQRPGQTCVRPYQATITVRVAATRRLVARVHSRADGRFSVRLAPGNYLLVPQTGRPFPRASPQTTTVVAHRFTSVVISYDTGIR